MVLNLTENEHTSACCGSCQNAHNHARSRFVVGVFVDAAGANGVAEKLRRAVGRDVNVLTSSVLSQSAPMMACSRLYQQINQHLASGATVVVVNTQSPEQQLGASRILLDSKCSVLLTHDGARHPD